MISFNLPVVLIYVVMDAIQKKSFLVNLFFFIEADVKAKNNIHLEVTPQKN